MNAHSTNGTWELVSRPVGKKIIGSKWVFKVKRNADGSVERYNVRMPIIWVVLAMAAIQDLHFRSIDIFHAYLNGEMDCDVYMEQPEGFAVGDPRQMVCLLKKSIYGMKQGGNRWNHKMRSVLEAIGYTQSYLDASIYIYFKDNVRIILPVFVDDMTFASKYPAAIDKKLSHRLK